MSGSGATLRLSIWRNFHPERPLAHFGADAAAMQLVGASDDLQQEVFSWQVKESVLSGVADNDVRAKLMDALFGPFNAGLSPTQRGMAKLRVFVELAEKAVRSEETMWSISEDPAFEDDEEPYNLNTLLAFVHHLRWILAIFGDEPGISVSIR